MRLKKSKLNWKKPEQRLNSSSLIAKINGKRDKVVKDLPACRLINI
jgi:hypothetical protein